MAQSHPEGNRVKNGEKQIPSFPKLLVPDEASSEAEGNTGTRDFADSCLKDAGFYPPTGTRLNLRHFLSFPFQLNCFNTVNSVLKPRIISAGTSWAQPLFPPTLAPDGAFEPGLIKGQFLRQFFGFIWLFLSTRRSLTTLTAAQGNRFPVWLGFFTEPKQRLFPACSLWGFVLDVCSDVNQQ